MIDVATNADIRRENAKLLAGAVGGSREFARLLGREETQVSQIIGKNPQRQIGPKLARLIEQKFGKPEGWLDVPHDEQEPLQEPAVAFARWFQSLPEDARAKLVQVAPIVTGYAVPDQVVEQRMPVTRRAEANND